MASLNAAIASNQRMPLFIALRTGNSGEKCIVAKSGKP